MGGIGMKTQAEIRRDTAPYKAIRAGEERFYFSKGAAKSRYGLAWYSTGWVLFKREAGNRWTECQRAG